MKKILVFGLILFSTITLAQKTRPKEIREIREIFQIKIDDRFLFKFGDPASGNFGVAEARFFDNHLEIRIPIAIYGAGHFSRINNAQKERAGLDPNLLSAIEEYQSPTIDSFNDHLRIKSLLASWREAFETVLSKDPRLSVKVDITMPHEARTLPQNPHLVFGYADYSRYLKDALAQESHKRRNTEPLQYHSLPVILEAFPEASHGDYAIWNPYAGAYSSIHKLGHMLGIGVEGTSYFDYPILGIMNSEADFAALREKGIHPELVEMEASTVLAYAMQSKLSPEQFTNAKPMFGQLTNDFKSRYHPDYPEEMSASRLHRRAQLRMQSIIAEVTEACDAVLIHPPKIE